MTTDPFETKLVGELESLGEDQVRDNFLGGKYSGGRKLEIIEKWLRHKETARSEAAIARAESREERAILIAERATSEAERANSISENALRIARQERTIAIIAIALSTITAIAVALIEYLRK